RLPACWTARKKGRIKSYGCDKSDDWRCVPFPLDGNFRKFKLSPLPRMAIHLYYDPKVSYFALHDSVISVRLLFRSELISILTRPPNDTDMSTQTLSSDSTFWPTTSTTPLPENQVQS